MAYQPSQERQQRQPYSQIDQDGDLEEVYAGARRLNQNARGIHGEVLSQNPLIDQLGSDVHAGTSALQAQTAKAELVNKRKKKLCKMYITIAFLVLILIGVLILKSIFPFGLGV